MLSLWVWEPEEIIIVRRAPAHGWLSWLLQGWRLPEGAHAFEGHDGRYNVRMWRRG